MKCTRDNTAVLVVDYQTKLIPAISDKERLLNRSAMLLKGLKTLGIPMIISQQYTKGLGETVPEIREAVGDTWPDITVYLRMPPEKALSRRLSASEPDRLEREKEAFFVRTYEAYEALYAQAGMERVVTVDAAQAIEDVTRDMLRAVDQRLGCTQEETNGLS